MNIELVEISKNFEGEEVLNHVNFESEIHSIAIIGPSGGGKSTLLRIIGGLLEPDSGILKLDDEEIIFKENKLQEYRRQIGFVFQSKGLFEHYTAEENVILPLIHTFKIKSDEAILIAEKLFERFGLMGEKNKYPFQLSGGQQQRIAIARAVAIKPKLLLLDEPTSALDPEYTAEVLNMLEELQLEGLKTMIVTHEMGFAKKSCEKIIFLADSQIIEVGASHEIFAAPKTEALRDFLSLVLEWRM